MARHYLDHASTSPPRPEAVAATLDWLGRAADPGRVHTEGRMVRAAIEEARAQVASLVGARPREVVFTSGATEAANAAVWGAMAGAGVRAAGGVAVGDAVGDAVGVAVGVAAVEHSCVRDASARHRTVALSVDSLGRIDVDSIPSDLRSVGLVHCQFANHEVGALQPVADVVSRCRDSGVLVHVDAAQAVGHVPVDFGALGADLMSVSGHKFGGPPGVGALVIRRGLRLDPFILGGEQERARRAGMENVPAIVGMGAAAASLAGRDVMECEASQARAQTTRLLAALTSVKGVVAYGDTTTDGRLPHIICVGVEGVEAEAVLLGLDQAGIAAHSGSACSSETLEPSPVLEAMGVEAEHSLRLSVGWNTTDADIDAAIIAFPLVVERLRALGRADLQSEA